MNKQPVSSELELLRRRIKREQDARHAAESILESKSQELFDANRQLTKVASDLREQMGKYQTIFEYAAQGIVTVDSHWRIKTFNPAAEKIFQIASQDAIHCSFQSLFGEESKAWLLETFEKEETGPKDLVGKRSNGNEFVVELTTSLVSESEETHLVALVRDRTRRQQLEAQLRHAQKMESVGHLAAGIAHEINTPIQFVGDNIRFLLSTFDEIEQLLELITQYKSSVNEQDRKKMIDCSESIDLDFIRHEVPEAIEQSIVGIDRVSAIVQAMKEFSHPGQADSTVVDVNRALESTITVSRNEWKYVAELKTDFDPDLPAILGLPGDLNQAFLNIIVNAAHAIESRGDYQKELGIIHITTLAKPDGVEIRFSDNGCGIQEGNLRRIFEPFFTTKPIGKGTGQGLSVVHSVIVERHGGEIKIESNPGHGTTFIVQLPVDKDHRMVDEGCSDTGQERV